MEKTINLKFYLAILATGLMAFCGVLIETAMNITFPTLMREFSLNTASIQWITTSYLLVVSIIVPIASYLQKRFTIRRLFLVANSLFIIGLLIDSFAGNFMVLILGRLIQGCGTGIALPLMYAIILTKSPADKIGFFMGIGGLVTAVAPALGPTYGGLIVGINWHLIFAILLVVMIFSLLIGSYAISADSKTEKVPFDFAGWLLIALTFASLIVGFSGFSSSFQRSLILIAIGLVALAGFVYHSNHVQHPIIHLAVMKNPAFNLHLLSYSLLQMVNVGISFILPNYLQIVDKQSSFIAGLLLFPGAALGACLAPIGGRIMDNLGAKKPIITGLVLQLLAVLFLDIYAKNANTILILIMYMGTMFGMGFSFGNIMTNGLAQAEESQRSDGNTLFNSMMQFSAAFGTALVSVIITLSQKNGSRFAETTATGAQRALTVLLALTFINIISISFALRQSKNKS
ncbi:DHA2 family efflux MFS transporter permease subunit [Oenococcus sicerae]|nr:DHA2 family efflux MFS transporter permease subunit [Oenococcus sicerae]